MVNTWDELKECNILKLILIVRFACATLDVGHPIYVIRTRLNLLCGRPSTHCDQIMRAATGNTQIVEQPRFTLHRSLEFQRGRFTERAGKMALRCLGQVLI
jgi:hypothetical protein